MTKLTTLAILSLFTVACGDNNAPPSGEADARAGTPDAMDAIDANAPDAMAIDAAPPEPTYLYWADFGGPVSRYDFDTGETVQIVANGPGTGAIAVDPVSQTIFFNQGAPMVITRADLEGAKPVDIVTAPGFVSGLAVDSTNGKLYWTDFTNGAVKRADLDGSNQETLISDTGSPAGLTVDAANDRIFFGGYNEHDVRSAGLDGSNLSAIRTGLMQPFDVAADTSAQRVFLADRGTTVEVFDYDGSNPGSLITAQTGPVESVALDRAAGKVYFGMPGIIRRADLADGGNVEDVVAATQPSAIAILPPPQ